MKEGLDDRDRKLVASEENLRDETRKLKAILNSIGEGVVVADPSGEFLVFNPAAKQILGRDPNDSPVENWAEYFGVFCPIRLRLIHLRTFRLPVPSEGKPPMTWSCSCGTRICLLASG